VEVVEEVQLVTVVLLPCGGVDQPCSTLQLHLSAEPKKSSEKEEKRLKGLLGTLLGQSSLFVGSFLRLRGL
jgi:hypothetical protein